MRLTNEHHIIILLPGLALYYRSTAAALFSPDISLDEVTIGNEVIEHFALNVLVGFQSKERARIGFNFAGTRPPGEPDGQLDMLFEPSMPITARDERRLSVHFLNNGFTELPAPKGTMKMLLFK